MHDTQRFAISIALFAGGYGPCSANGRNVRALVSHMLIIAGGLMPSSLSVGFSPCMKPMSWRANPDEETTDWRAVCGRTACTVRRAGRVSAFPDPYQADPQAGDGHEHGFVRPSPSLQQGPFSQTFHLLKDFFGLMHQVLDNLPCGFDIVY